MFRRVVLVVIIYWITSVYPQCTCDNTAFQSVCDTAANHREQYVNEMIVLDCATGGSWERNLASANSRNFTNITEMIMNNSRYSLSGSRLTISNLLPEDEGVYRCSSQSHCVLVVHPVQFQACPSTLLIDQCEAPSVEVINGFSPVEFNTFITFGSSVCNCTQELQSLTFRSLVRLFAFYSCVDGMCNDGSMNTNISISSGTASNFSLQFIHPLPVKYNATRFEFRVSGPRSGGSGSRSFELFFTIYIREPSPTTPPSTTEMTTDPVTGSSSGSPEDQLPVIVPVTLVGIVVVAMIGVAVAFCMYRRCTKHHSISKKLSAKNDEVIYADIDDKRGSKAYSSFKGHSAPPDLSTTLESFSVSA